MCENTMLPRILKGEANGRIYPHIEEDTLIPLEEQSDFALALIITDQTVCGWRISPDLRREAAAMWRDRYKNKKEELKPWAREAHRIAHLGLKNYPFGE